MSTRADNAEAANQLSQLLINGEDDEPCDVHLDIPVGKIRKLWSRKV